MSDFRFVGTDAGAGEHPATIYATVSPGGLLTFRTEHYDAVAPIHFSERVALLHFAIEDAANSYYTTTLDYENWKRARARILETLKKYTRADIEWKVLEV